MSFADPDAGSGTSNFLLSVLPPDELAFLRPHLEAARLPVRTIFAEFSEPLSHAFFPDNGMLSLLTITEAGQACEVGFIGFEGMIGLPSIIGKNKMPYQILVQAESAGFRVPLHVAAELFQRKTAFHDISLRFAYVLFRQFAQTSACNRFHTVAERLCRWLAVMCERSNCNELPLTQEFLAYMLGVQRTSVAEIAADLQSDGLIAYSRGKVEILDLDGVISKSCECLALIENEHRDFLQETRDSYKSTTRQTAG